MTADQPQPAAVLGPFYTGQENGNGLRRAAGALPRGTAEGVAPARSDWPVETDPEDQVVTAPPTQGAEDRARDSPARFPVGTDGRPVWRFFACVPMDPVGRLAPERRDIGARLGLPIPALRRPTAGISNRPSA